LHAKTSTEPRLHSKAKAGLLHAESTAELRRLHPESASEPTKARLLHAKTTAKAGLLHPKASTKLRLLHSKLLRLLHAELGLLHASPHCLPKRALLRGILLLRERHHAGAGVVH